MINSMPGQNSANQTVNTPIKPQPYYAYPQPPVLRLYHRHDQQAVPRTYPYETPYHVTQPAVVALETHKLAQPEQPQNRDYIQSLENENSRISHLHRGLLHQFSLISRQNKTAIELLENQKLEIARQRSLINALSRENDYLKKWVQASQVELAEVRSQQVNTQINTASATLPSFKDLVQGIEEHKASSGHPLPNHTSFKFHDETESIKLRPKK